ncbi:ATP-binding protein [uncultured Alteromonas sp.]|uniref:sensor histidine kinase n=1 Tax=uncultured Alteromonas sp. TaxID=179113 RepID=UPI0026014896|nr:ATP-binding protein [uncultured Alteromonas sp.]
MTDVEKLHETIQKLRYENSQLQRFKQVNQLMLNGLDAIMTSMHRSEVFARLFEVIGEILPCDQILIAHHNEEQSTVIPVCCSTEGMSFKPLRYTDLTNVFEETMNIFNVALIPGWKAHLGGWLPDANSVLIHPISTSQAKYIWLISDKHIGAFSKQYEDIFVSFSAFVANTLSHFEQRSLIRERETLLEERGRIEKSMIHQEKMAALGQLAAGVAHELNNPLGFINSNLASLQDYLGDISEFVSQAVKSSESMTALHKKMDMDYILTDTDDLIDESLEGIRRSTDIIANLKSFSHPDEKTRVNLELNAVIELALTIIRTQAKTVVDIDFTPCEAKPVIHVNANQLAQVFINIVTNAMQAMTDNNGRITITIVAEKTAVNCRIRDNGPGMPAAVAARIFDPFFTTKTVGMGTGLGLSISKAIIEKYGGELHLESSSAKGSCFLIRLPRIID